MINKDVLNFGTIAGLIAYGIFLLNFELTGANPYGIQSYLTIWIPFYFIYKVVTNEREKAGGVLRFGSAAVTGMMFCMIYGSLFAMLGYCHGYLFDDSFIQLHQEEVERAMALLGDDSPFKEVNMEEMDNLTLGKIVLMDLNGKIIGGTLLSIIMAWFLKKN